ncbi:heme ABC transporter ATP-binding protein [Natronolimnobius sp. AArcel1]|uniref:heme ABC transporter ATP-binding protein n=1 Tax=Natronolimnobius sp. AArcel1 TaxID=1679093 RepID=UPI0013EA58C8|nr:heme ABC transporter ATP-binding protein [Natronolimnobius sp. AArcel1]NGM70841.1 heme ABC transporter ATP-binding protein [Natronolimnobius sp. AArcel1]
MIGFKNSGEPDQSAPPTGGQIDVDNVSVSFGDVSVLENASLAVEPGEFIGLVGPNGAGKTTLLRAISGALTPTSGTVTVDETDIHSLSSKASSRRVAVVPQDTTLSFSFDVETVVEMGRHPHRSRFSPPTAADREAVDHALERTRTTQFADRPIDELSGGERQRVVLARAIAQETPVMLLDEPTASLDVTYQIETLELVRELVEEGRTVVAAIHDLNHAARYCDRLVMLADGGVYRSGSPTAVLTGAAVADVFDATAAVTTNPVTGTETVTALPDKSHLDQTQAETQDETSAESVRVHVFGTGATAAGVLARLETAAAAIDPSIGPVTAGDTAAETARSLGVERLEVAPFESLSSATVTAFEESVQSADITVVTESVLERATRRGTKQLLETVAASAGPVVVAGPPDDGVELDSSHAPTMFESATTVKSTPETVLEAISDGISQELKTPSSAD